MISRIPFLKDALSQNPPVDHFPGLLPEMEMILRCINPAPAPAGDRDAAIKEIVKKGIDWNRLVKLALQHRVLPLLYKGLTKTDDSLLKQEEMAQLKSIYRHNALRNLRQAQNLHRVLELLSSEGIDVIVIKGPALAIQAYDDLSLRTFSDLDLLIHSKDFDKIYDTLTNAGFRSSFPLDKEMKRYWRLFRRDIGFCDDISGIDIHHQLTQGPKRISLKEKTWQNQGTAELLFRDIPLLSPEHSLFCLSLHGTKDNWSYLKNPADMAHLVGRHPHLDWHSLIADVEDTGCLRMLLTGLILCRLICGLELPGEIAELLLSRPQVERSAGEYLHRMLAGKAKEDRLQGTFSLMRSMDSAGPRLSLLIHSLFIPTPVDWQSIKLPTFLYPLYCLIRPLRLFFKLLSRSLSYLL
ncbi:MAG: nucleotidyltransferase family protein [Candidatus Aminicenantes bacterium]|nr:nucleotidyltransferase family protein [Candidatus Aminicenantes bacterium]